MRPNWSNIIATCVLALAVTPALAGNDGGRITFQGAIVTPTCTVPTTWNAPTAQSDTNRQQGCENATRAGLKAQDVDVHAVHLTNRKLATLLRDFTANGLANVDAQTRTLVVQYRYR
jgi:type 1 fimbria pilin